VPGRSLEPLPYHLQVRDHLREHAAAAWTHFASDALAAKHAEELELALLQSTYRLTEESHARVHTIAREVAARLGLEVRVELYQGPSTGGLNAALFFVPGAARVVFQGPIEERLDDDELRALLGHELAHHLLYTAERGEIFTTSRMLAALAAFPDAGSLAETDRVFGLVTEIFADRGSLAACGSADAVVRCLIKTETELATVDAKAFLAQADEVLARAGSASTDHGHPRAYIRAKAVALAADGGDIEDRVQELIDGRPELDDLDVLHRARLTELTRDVVDHVLAPRWFRTGAARAHATLLFDDYAPRTPRRSTADLRAALARYGPSVLDYVSYLLVDFVAVEPELEDLPLARNLALAEELDVAERFETHVNRELKLTKKAIESVRARRKSLLEAAESAR
jgi:hypothetical protein